MDRLDEDPLNLAARLASALAGYGVTDICLTGSAALGVWATPRQSRDLDLCARVPAAAVSRILARFDGVAAGPPDAPTVLRLSFARWDIDVFVSRDDDAYDRACAARAAAITGMDVSLLRVVLPEDLMIQKMFKLRTDRRRILQDVTDLRALLETRGDGIDWVYVETWLPENEFFWMKSLAALSDEELLSRPPP